MDSSSTFRTPPPQNQAQGAAAPLEESLILDEVGRAAFWEGQRLDLSTTEFAVLAYLKQRVGQTVSHDSLLQAVWGSSLDQGGSLAQVRSTITRLRQKLAKASGHSCQLVSVRGVGYRLDFSPTAQGEQYSQVQVSPKTRRRALLSGLVVILVAVLVVGWLLRRQVPGNPCALVWYRGYQVPVGLLQIFTRHGPYCCVGPDGHPYCFDTQEERAAALGISVPGVASEVLEKLRMSGAVPDLRPTNR